ncbi:GPW/gp25 family protein [Desulfosporosinus sp. PR]|uniref:GPW/gp25 family protein n=1 Tax=Candidatus Desulfosporosinus nitrosoreducens TaxID=3401928 RepID=UPI0027F63B9A|nr:GPW/gp25 family protein [Desulfosporosinus sp. PR]MDQ7096754.1 GPW/gp25 family protein [Desulfosporosinus sp. PR]
MSSESDSKGFLGQGFKFPFSINRQTGKIAMVEHEEDIQEAIEIILKTNVGERVMRPEFGSTVSNFVYSVNRLESVSAFETEIVKALEQFEPRIQDIKVGINNSDGDKSTVIVNIQYKVRTTNNQFNKVYPFYILEGAGA